MVESFAVLVLGSSPRGGLCPGGLGIAGDSKSALIRLKNSSLETPEVIYSFNSPLLLWLSGLHYIESERQKGRRGNETNKIAAKLEKRPQASNNVIIRNAYRINTNVGTLGNGKIAAKYSASWEPAIRRSRTVCRDKSDFSYNPIYQMERS